jgi:hypothetical protein
MPKLSRRDNGKAVNKSAAIREMLAQHPQATTKEIVSMLGETGIKVQPSLVYLIKSKERKMRRKQKRQLVKETSQRTGTSNPVELVLRVKNLAMDAGGINNLKLLVDALAD